MKILKLLFPFILLSALILCLSLLSDFHPVKSGLTSVTIDLVAKKGDKPWDPGDEGCHIKSVNRGIYLLAKKGDKPWDPGDEGHNPGRPRNA
ncbi:MAG: hypothetical protein ABIC40_08400 [bacterium]